MTPHTPRRAAIAALALLAAAACPTAALARGPRHERSANWAGYAVAAAQQLTAVSGSWREPAAKCDQPFPTYSAFWVGLGGFKRGSHALEQIGTEADCTSAGRTNNYVWYELVPAPPMKLKLKIRPGDLVSARVTLRNRYLVLRIHNLSTGRGFTRTVRMRSPDTSSAEWIAEAPSACISPDQCQTLPLADFGAIRFYDANAKTAPGKRGAINDPTLTTTELTLTGSGPGSGPGPGGPGPVTAGSASAEATPGALTGHGSAFTVTVKRPAAPPGPPPFSAPDKIRHPWNKVTGRD